MTLQFDGVALITSDAAALANFYCTALGFTRDPAVPNLLHLGGQRVELIQPDHPDAPYPTPAQSNDPWFQHIAIVVRDIRAGFEHAMAHGAMPISINGPQKLPASSGGVTAWKFRDPELHPAEFLEFPPDATPAYWQKIQTQALFLGIDHSAIVVSDATRSIEFYRTLGFTASAQSTNVGAEQSALDNLPAPDVLVTALALPGQAAPHLELLQYRAPITTSRPAWTEHDFVATRLRFGSAASLKRDPDGHFLSGC